MVSFYFYTGKMHKVPDVPRQWQIPKHSVSLKDFEILNRKRAKALSRLQSTTSTHIPNPNPSPNPKSFPNSDSDSFCKQQNGEEGDGDSGCSKQNDLQIIETSQAQLQSMEVKNPDEGPSQENRSNGDAIDQSGVKDDPCPERPREIDGSVSCPGIESTAGLDNGCSLKDGRDTSQALEAEKPLVSAQPLMEISNNSDVTSIKAKRKRELMDKLLILKEKKHNLVQKLKQILHVEEELSKRSSMQSPIIRTSSPLQVDAATDMGSMSRHVGPRMGSEANFGGDPEGEAEDVSNQNSHICNFHRMSSTSPIAASPIRRPAYPVPLTPRAILGGAGHTHTTSGIATGVTASPSRFAPTTHQATNPSNLPPLSVSGTHYNASSPSPAASGGTSVFRDSRLTSPSWN